MKLKEIKAKKENYKSLVHTLFISLQDDERTLPFDTTDKLYRIEKRLTRLNEQECNGLDASREAQRSFYANIENQRKRINKEITSLIPRRLSNFLPITQDPRGYALKLSPEFNGSLYKLERDLGGDYILCPEFK